jgi:hypothetical protein
VHAGLAAEPVDEVEGDREPLLPRDVVGVALESRRDDLVRGIRHGDVHPAVAEVDAEELAGAGVEGEPLGGSSTAGAHRGIRVGDDDRAALEEARGDLGEGRAREADALGEVAAAERAVGPKGGEHALLMRPPHEGVDSGRRRHV